MKEVCDLLNNKDLKKCEVHWSKQKVQSHIHDFYVDELYALCQTQCMCCLTEGCSVYSVGETGFYAVCRSCALKSISEYAISQAPLLYNTTSGTYQEEENTPLVGLPNNCSFVSIRKEDYLTAFCRMLPDN